MAESVTWARRAVAYFASRYKEDSGDISLAVSEAVTNAVMHAYSGVPIGNVRIEGHRRGSDLVVTVADDGVGMKPNLASSGLGLGWALIAAVSREVTYDSSGRGLRVTMRFAC